MIQAATLKFLKNLKENNDKSWMDAHREDFLAAKENFAEVIDKVIKQFGKKEEGIETLTAKDCVFRQNRDIRFSKNKSPYKSNMGAYLNKDGKKSPLGGYYFHCEPGNKSFVGGGLWMPEAPVLKKVRQEVDYCWDEFNKILHDKKFAVQFGDLDSEDTLSREPKGYEKDNPAIKYLKLKSFVAMKPLTDEELKSTDLVKNISSAFETIQPLIRFINRAIED